MSFQSYMDLLWDVWARDPEMVLGLGGLLIGLIALWMQIEDRLRARRDRAQAWHQRERERRREENQGS